MHFIYPAFLFALATLAIPIIIHLFNFRRFKKIYFTNVRFLREIKQDTQSKSRLRHLLILFSRLLAVTFLVFAFAQPYIPVSQARILSGVKTISIYIDNSFSMDALGKNGNLLETARKKAREISSAYKPTDQFQLLTSDFEARHQRIVSRDEFLQLLDDVKPGSSLHTLSEVMERQQEALSSGQNKNFKKAYIISDFQKSITDPDFRPETTILFSLVPVEASKQNNLYIDTCFLSTPFVQLNNPNELTVVVKNKGAADAENIPIRLSINGTQKAVGGLSVKSGSSAEAKLSFTLSQPGWQQAVISITDYPVTFDDDYYFSFNLRNSIEILSINGKDPNASLNAVFSNDPYFNFRNLPVGQIDYSIFPSTQLLILNEVVSFSSGMIHEIQQYVKNGGALFIIPTDNASIASYNELLSSIESDTYTQLATAPDKITFVETKSKLLETVFEKGKAIPENLDLPVVNRYFIFSHRTKSNSQSIMKLQSGNPFLTASEFGRGHIYVLASSLQTEASSFPRHALFVPVLLRAALLGSSEVNSTLVIGRDHEFIITDTLVSNDNVFHLINTSLKFDIIPESRLLNSNTIVSVHDQVNAAQNYELKSGEKVITVKSFNYDRKESDLSCYTVEELEKIATKPGYTNINVINNEGKDLSHSISQLNEGKRLWKYCIIAVLIFLAIEVLLIRFYKRSTLSVK